MLKKFHIVLESGKRLIAHIDKIGELSYELSKEETTCKVMATW